MSIKRTLSKSDFKLATDCFSKLYYKKHGYASGNDGNEYLNFLAEGGYLIGGVSKLVIPGGIDVQQEVRMPDFGYRETTERALSLTQALMERDNVILYEPAFQVGQRLVRVDILVKQGSDVELIEVKSKAQDSNATIWDKQWQPYIDDVAFQLIVVRQALPSCHVTPWLLTPDKSYVATIDHLTSFFRLKELGWTGSFRDTDVEYLGNADLATQIRTCGLLRRWDVQEPVKECLDRIEQAAKQYESWLAETELVHPKTQLSKNCFGCEYDALSDDGRNGFHECWGVLAAPERHIRQLYRIGSLGGWQNPTANRWIAEERVSHDDIGEQDLLNARGQLGSYGERILIQIMHTRSATEWIDVDGLRAELAGWEYPLHFIDFEATASPLPYHLGMRPYQTVVFQWSCHTIATPGAEPVHRGFLNTESYYPAIEFLGSLRAAIGDKGTAIMWSPYERTQLRNLREWLLTREEGNHCSIVAWINDLTGDDRAEVLPSAPRLVDQHALVPKHWFHPRMGGRTSIKVALPAALAATTSGRIDHWLRDVGLLDPKTGLRPDNPYQLLPSLGVPGLNGDDLDTDSGTSVTDGVEAMRAYQDMVYGRHMNNPARRDQIRDALTRYCRLDTLAQVIIWEHWRTKLDTL